MLSERLNFEVVDPSSLCVWDLNVFAGELLGYLVEDSSGTPVVKELGEDGEWDLIDVYLPTDCGRLMWLVAEYKINLNWVEEYDGVYLKASLLSGGNYFESKSNDGMRAILDVVVKLLMFKQEKQDDGIN